MKDVLRPSALPALMTGLQTLWYLVPGLAGWFGFKARLFLFAGAALAAGLAVTLWPGRRADRRLSTGIPPLRRLPLRRALAWTAVAVFGAAVMHLQPVQADETSVLAVSILTAERGPAALFDGYAGTPWLGAQHPPLAVLFNALAISVFGPGLHVLRLLCWAFALGTGALLVHICRRHAGERTADRAAVFLFAMPLFFRVGTLATNDMPMVFFFVLASGWTLDILRNPNTAKAAVLGAAVAAGVMTKYTMALFFPIVAAAIFTLKPGRKSLLCLGIAAAVSAVLCLPWLLWAGAHGVLVQHAQKIGFYAGVVTRDAWGLRFLLDTLLVQHPSAVGAANIPILLWGTVLLRKGGVPDRFVFGWILTVYVILFTTLPGNRYFLPVFPALAVAAGRALDRPGLPAARILILASLYALLYFIFQLGPDRTVFLF